MKKKVLVMVLCLAMAVGMMTGCGAKKAETSAPPASEVTFDAQPEYDPNSEYDKYTVFEYTIVDANATFPVTVSASEDESKMELHFNFYGDEQLVTAEKDGDTFKIVTDKTGFMEKDGPLICQKCVENNNWAAIEK